MRNAAVWGGGYYSGMYAPYLETNVLYVSTGIPGTPFEGEHYLPSPESMRAFMDDVAPPPAPKNVASSSRWISFRKTNLHWQSPFSSGLKC